MSNLPVSFGKTDIVKNSSLHLSYSFEKILSVEALNSQLPYVQDYKIKALKLNLEGKTSNPSISISIDANTVLFTLNNCYITDLYPHEKDVVTAKAFVIEGYSVEHVNKERLMIYLPMKETADTNNLFINLETAIMSTVPNTRIENGLDLNAYIPSASLEKDLYTYFKHSDNNGTVYHNVYFNETSLGYTSALKVPANTDEYSSLAQIMNYKSSTVAKEHSSMTNDFEDNIYIDCVPVDLLEQNKKKYLKVDPKYTSKFKQFIFYIAYFVILTLIVYGIYYIYIFATGLKMPALPFPIPIPTSLNGSVPVKARP